MSWFGAALGLCYAMYDVDFKFISYAAFLFPLQYTKFLKLSTTAKLAVKTFLCAYFGSIAGSATYSAFISFLPCALAATYAVALEKGSQYFSTGQKEDQKCL
jgi:uncharacterized membrane protein YdjX (TVP38/TMEM64 family)